MGILANDRVGKAKGTARQQHDWNLVGVFNFFDGGWAERRRRTFAALDVRSVVGNCGVHCGDHRVVRKLVVQRCYILLHRQLA